MGQLEASAEPGQWVDAVAMLQSPLRRSIFSYVCRADEAVSRDQAAETFGIARPLAAYHLDKLLDCGLLRSSYRRLSPGPGRASKLYYRSDTELSVSFPARDYELPARLFARVLQESADSRVIARIRDLADELGRSLGVRTQEATDHLPADPSDRLMQRLSSGGFDPEQDGDRIRLRNCPFSALSGDFADLVCEMNLALVRGVVEGIDSAGIEAHADRGLGRCCVVLKVTSA